MPGERAASVWSLLDREASLTRRLGHGYLLALSLVAFLSLAGLVIVGNVLSLHLADATMINVAGRQRMLSQKISKLALEIDRAYASGVPDQAAPFADELATAISEWRTAHESLRDRPNESFPGHNTRTVAARIAEAEPHIEPISAAANDLAASVRAGVAERSSVAADTMTILAHEDEFLAAMERVVETHEDESLARVALLEDIEQGLVAATVMTLLLEALLIFRPALRLLLQTQLRLREALAAKAASERSKSAILEAVPDVVVQLDRRGICRLVHVPPTLELPLFRAPLEGRSLADALPPSTAREVAARIAVARARDLPQRFEFALPSRGRERRLEARVVLAGLDDVLVLLRDITEQRALEREVIDAASNERRRIGRNLHDGLCQHLAGLSLLVGSLSQRAHSSGALRVDAATLDQIGELLERALRESRQIARALHPLALELDGLASALQEIASSIEALYGIRCRAEVELGGWQPSIATAAELVWITQEAASNAARHSAASTVRISLVHADERVVLTISDDGVGLGGVHLTPRGMGLRIMEHRAHVLGAWLHIASTEGKGTVVTCELSTLA